MTDTPRAGRALQPGERAPNAAHTTRGTARAPTGWAVGRNGGTRLLARIASGRPPLLASRA
eukprot:4995232-Pyramimonas_sp.AAC.1